MWELFKDVREVSMCTQKGLWQAEMHGGQSSGVQLLWRMVGGGACQDSGTGV